MGFYGIGWSKGTHMKRVMLVGIAALWPLASWAQEIKPFDAKVGLWETTATTEIGGLPAMPQIPEEALSKMTPAQRAQVEAMMKARGGAGGPKTTTSKSCVTKESLSKALAMGEGEKQCTRKLVSSSSSKQQIHIECERETMKTTGDITLERIDDEHAKMSMVAKSGDNQHPITIKMTGTSKWLSSDCGDVKPIGEK